MRSLLLKDVDISREQFDRSALWQAIQPQASISAGRQKSKTVNHAAGRQAELVMRSSASQSVSQSVCSPGAKIWRDSSHLWSAESGRERHTSGWLWVGAPSLDYIQSVTRQWTWRSDTNDPGRHVARPFPIPFSSLRGPPGPPGPPGHGARGSSGSWGQLPHRHAWKRLDKRAERLAEPVTTIQTTC